MEFFDVVKNRFSCRKFSTKPVEDEKLDKILEAARVAPTAKNAQPVKIWIMKSPEALEKIKSVSPIAWLKDSPVILVVGGNSEEAFTRPFDGKNFAEIDATIVATHLLLAIDAAGLNSTWIGMFDEAKAKELFPEMKNYDLVALFPVAYKADNAQPSDRHETRKSKDEIVKYL